MTHYRRLALIVTVLASFLTVLWWRDPVQAQLPAQSETISRCGTAAPIVAPISITTSGNIVTLASSQRIYVCAFALESDTASTAVQWFSATNTDCNANMTDLTGPYTLAANTPLALSNGGATQFTTAASRSLCLELSASTGVNGHITYVQY